MGFQESVRYCLSNYTTLSGRAKRAEYWWFYLFTCLVLVAFGAVFLLLLLLVLAINGGGAILVLWGLITLIAMLALVIPTISVSVRRLHDTHNSGWLWWIQLVPYVGSTVFIVLMLLPSYPVNNTYGEFTT